MPVAATDRCAVRQGLAGLYGITLDGTPSATLFAHVAAAIDGGARAIQYRSKSALPDVRLAEAATLAQLCRGRALFIVNDDAQLAADVHADGVHIGDDDGSLAAARALMGRDALVGVSCYNDFARAERAVAAGADYVAFGSFYPSRVKPAARVAELSLLPRSRALGVPVVAIGGIDAGNAGALVAAGASAVAVISALFDQPTPAAVRGAAQALSAAVAGASANAGIPLSHTAHQAHRPT